MPGAERHAFQYAILRLVPRIERGERLNVGVVLFARQHGSWLGMRAQLDPARVRALAPDLDLALVQPHLDALCRVAAGDPAGGPLASLPASERFGWLVAPGSTILQPSAVHTGLTDDPQATLDRLFGRLVG